VREQLSIDEMAGYGNFLELLQENFANSLSTLFSEDVIIDVQESGSADSDGLKDGFEGQAVIYFTEKESGAEGAILFKTVDITSLADMMMMGDGEGVQQLDDELKDAVSELSTQMLSAINVPFTEKFDEKVAFSVNTVEEIGEDINLSENQFYYSDLLLKVKDKQMPFRFGISDTFSSKLGEDETSEDTLEDSSMNNFDSNEQPQAAPQVSSMAGKSNMNMLLDVDIPVSVKVGSTKMFLKDIVGLGPGNIIELDEYADEPVELMVNDKPIARGEVVVVDGYFGIRIKEIISIEERIKKLKD